MYGADGLPLMLDQSWFSIRMRNTVWMGQAPEQVPGRVVVVVEVVEGHVNGPQVNPQLMSPTSHCAILRASSMLQAPSPLTSHASGWVSWLHWRSPTSNWATTSASPMLTTPSPLTSPHGAAAIVVVVVPPSVVVVVVVTAAQTAGSVGSASAKSRAQSW